ncbi:MAG: hypothetical protein ABI581_11760 [Sediminibacterium sp.]
MKPINNILVIAASISFTIVIGAGMYEHLVLVPKWAAAPPTSLDMFRGLYALNPGAFWMPIHPITLLLLIGALVFNWNTARRKYLLIHLAGYVLILALTTIYFVPELLAIIHTPYQNAPDAALTKRASQWEKLSIARMIFCIVIASVLLLSLTKGNERKMNID